MKLLDLNKKIAKYLRKEILYHEYNSLREDYLLKFENYGTFCWNNYTGRLSDYDIEKLLIQLSSDNRIKDTIIQPKVRREVKRVLHYCTTLYCVGGHTKMLSHWLKNDIYEPYLYVSNQENELPENIKKLKVYTRIDKAETFIKRLENLLLYLNKVKPDVIVLHNHPDDFLPILVKPYIENIPIIFYNHADFGFSYCSTICDLAVSINKESSKINRSHRNINADYTLPLNVSNEKDNKSILIEDEVNIAIMASSYKIKPIDRWNIFKVIDEILKTSIPAKIHIIGMTSKDVKDFIIKDNPYLLFYGKVADPQNILKTCHLFIESIPYGTGLGTLEAVSLGCYPIFNPIPHLIYKKGAALNYFPEELISEYNAIDSFEKYLKFVVTKIKEVHDKGNIENKYKIYVNKHHNNIDWNKHLNNIYLINKTKKQIKSFQYSINTENEIYFTKLRRNVKANLKLFFRMSITNKIYTILFYIEYSISRMFNWNLK